jgi:hypothetical protein
MFAQDLETSRRLFSEEFLFTARFAEIGEIPGGRCRNGFWLRGKLP